MKWSVITMRRINSYFVLFFKCWPTVSERQSFEQLTVKSVSHLHGHLSALHIVKLFYIWALQSSYAYCGAVDCIMKKKWRMLIFLRHSHSLRLLVSRRIAPLSNHKWHIYAVCFFRCINIGLQTRPKLITVAVSLARMLELFTIVSTLQNWFRVQWKELLES